MPGEQRQRGLGWQVVLLLVCLGVGRKLTAVYGTRLAGVLHADFEVARTAIVIFFAAVVAIVGILAYRGVQREGDGVLICEIGLIPGRRAPHRHSRGYALAKPGYLQAKPWRSPARTPRCPAR